MTPKRSLSGQIDWHFPLEKPATDIVVAESTAQGATETDDSGNARTARNARNARNAKSAIDVEDATIAVACATAFQRARTDRY